MYCSGQKNLSPRIRPCKVCSVIQESIVCIDQFGWNLYSSIVVRGQNHQRSPDVSWSLLERYMVLPKTNLDKTWYSWVGKDYTLINFIEVQEPRSPGYWYLCYKACLQVISSLPKTDLRDTAAGACSAFHPQIWHCTHKILFSSRKKGPHLMKLTKFYVLKCSQWPIMSVTYCLTFKDHDKTCTNLFPNSSCEMDLLLLSSNINGPVFWD